MTDTSDNTSNNSRLPPLAMGIFVALPILLVSYLLFLFFIHLPARTAWNVHVYEKEVFSRDIMDLKNTDYFLFLNSPHNMVTEGVVASSRTKEEIESISPDLILESGKNTRDDIIENPIESDVLTYSTQRDRHSLSSSRTYRRLENNSTSRIDYTDYSETFSKLSSLFYYLLDYYWSLFTSIYQIPKTKSITSQNSLYETIFFSNGNCPTVDEYNEVLKVEYLTDKYDPINRNFPQSHPQFHPTIVRHRSGHSNGILLIGDFLIMAETTGRRLSILKWTDDSSYRPKVCPLVTMFAGVKFNSPNDIIQWTSDSILFTDPSYGCYQFPPDWGYDCPSLPDDVYSFNFSTWSIDTSFRRDYGLEFTRPNGIGVYHNNLNITNVYISDSGAILDFPDTINYNRPHNITKLILNSTTYEKIDSMPTWVDLPSIGIPDGIKIDDNGYVYVATGRGIDIYEDNGRSVLIGSLEYSGGQCSNLVIAPESRNLYIACMDRIFLFKTKASPYSKISTKFIEAQLEEYYQDCEEEI